MDRERQYWVVSPNVKNDPKTLKGWKELIKSWEVAIMGWRPDEKKHKLGKRMGRRFAGIGDPSIQQGDVILIGHSRTHKNLVAVGMIDSDCWMDTFTHLDEDPVQLRSLKLFKWLETLEGGEGVPVPQDLPLKKALPHSYAMTYNPLDLEDPDIRRVCEWMDQQLEDGKVLAARRRRIKYGRGGEGPDHKMLKEWCANNPQELGLSGVTSIPGRTEFSPCEYTADLADVIFRMREGRYAVIEVETSSAKPGAYQALKYKTLLCARQDYPVTSDKVQAILVAWEIPADVRDFCEQYGIICHEKRL